MTCIKSAAEHAGADHPARGRPREFDRAWAIDRAMELFWQKGYMQTTLTELCAAMDITPPSFYCAFRTRENLFLETVNHYMKTFWERPLADLMAEKDVHAALKNHLACAVGIYTRPGQPKGCFMEVSTVGLPPGESRIATAFRAAREATGKVLRARLIKAIEDEQIPADSDVPAITGSIIALMIGMAQLARRGFCRSELLAMAWRGMALL